MAEVDDPVQGRSEQVFLTLVARSAHRDPPQPIAPVNESRSAQNQNPKSQENDVQTPLSCESRYFNRTAEPAKSRLGEFFTGDHLFLVPDRCRESGIECARQALVSYHTQPVYHQPLITTLHFLDLISLSIRCAA
jgi:hypothetical protein